MTITKEEVSKEPCGCEFTTFIEFGSSGPGWKDEDYEFTTLTKCKCQKHYNEQLVAEWYDNDGNHHKSIREPNEVAGLVPLEVN